MSNDIVVLQESFDERSFTTPTALQDRGFALGQVVAIKDGANSSKIIKRFMYVKAHDTLTQYQPYVINFSAVSGAEVITSAPFTIATCGALVCVPQVAFTTAYYGWVQIEGVCTVLMSTESFAVGDFLQILDAGTTLMVDGTTTSTARTVSSCAMCKTTGSAAAAVSATLFGIYATVEAS